MWSYFEYYSWVVLGTANTEHEFATDFMYENFDLPQATGHTILLSLFFFLIE